MEHPNHSGISADGTQELSAHQKALKINLDPERYGTFAEIGAGQEVARWFFKVGAAAGTISKSISAYDMAISDAIYGHCTRYVSRDRLQSMLDHEHNLNLERLRPVRGDSTAFFAFADTVAARNYQGTNECHGWIGVKYQAHPRDAGSQISLRTIGHRSEASHRVLTSTSIGRHPQLPAEAHGILRSSASQAEVPALQAEWLSGPLVDQGPNACQTSTDTALTVSMPYCLEAFPLVSTAIR